VGVISSTGGNSFLKHHQKLALETGGMSTFHPIKELLPQANKYQKN